MIRVLIIDDEPNGVKSAKAGLFPQSDLSKNLDVDHLSKFSLNYFDIKFKGSIKSAIETLKSFIPDLVIIDINIHDKEHFKINDLNFENGIDIYRYINLKFPKMVKLLFSNHGNDPMYIPKLSEEEKMNFISKAKGSGYEILASAIKKYLKQVAQNIILTANENKRTDLIKLFERQNWDTIKDFKITIGDREFEAKNLLLFSSYPTIENGLIELCYTNPKEELIKLLKAFNQNENLNKTRSEWNSSSINDLFDYFTLDLESSTKKVYTLAERIIDSIIQNISKDSYLRLDSNIEFRLAKHIADKHTRANNKFIDKFYNSLSVRLVLRFFETFIRENIDTCAIKPNGNWKLFFNAMPNSILQSVKQHAVPLIGNEFSQEGINLNIGFKLKEDAREIVDISSYIEYDFESKWLHSKKSEDLYERIINEL